MTGVLVTGAGGFIGGHITRRLAREPDLLLRAATRDGRTVSEHAQPCRLDVRQPATLVTALEGMSAVVHCAVGDRATTVDGTAHLLQAARKAGISRFVQFSSVAVYGGAVGQVTESTKLVAPTANAYAHWKAAAEAQCRADGKVTVLRPTIVYGAGSRLWVELAAKRILGGHWGSFGAAGEGVCNLVHVSDVAEAALAALRSDRTGEAFNINGAEPLTWNAWFARLAAALGRPNLPSISPAAWRRRSLLALPAKALVRVVPPLRQPLAGWLMRAPAASERALFALKAHYPTDKAEHLLAWRPTTNLNDGLADSIAWLRSENILA